MRWSIMIAVVLASAASPSPDDRVREARGAILQTDAVRALQLLKGVDAASLPEKERKFVNCVRQRFASSAPPASNTPRTFTDRLVAIYQRYWHAALTTPKMREQQERRLDSSIRRLLGARKSDDLAKLVQKRIKADGYYSLESGRTGLLRDLVIWRTQTEKLTHVALPEGQYDVKVEYLDAFKSIGWSDYATCGRARTGGWTTEDALFVVVPSYDSLEDENFRVNFLGHESQHFADKTRFKGLKDWELEYRAKLVEVSMADKTRNKVMDAFIGNQGDDPADPHSYADRKVVNELVKRLQLTSARDLYAVDLTRLQTAARDILLEDTRQRQAATAVKP
jgi:hypothetical protein